MNDLVNVSIRLANTADIPEIARVHLESTKAGYRGFVPDQMLDGLSLEGRVQLWNDRFEAFSLISRVWVAESSGSAIGFCSAGVAGRPDAISHGVTEDAEIYSLFISPSHWRIGVGLKLANLAINYLRDNNFKSVILWTIIGNIGARRFYEYIGFFDDSVTKTTERFESGSLLAYDEVRFRFTLNHT
jgi:GNAT superfamily N-acetyltransferase